jgi:hypothetical protein
MCPLNFHTIFISLNPVFCIISSVPQSPLCPLPTHWILHYSICYNVCTNCTCYCTVCTCLLFHSSVKPLTVTVTPLYPILHLFTLQYTYIHGICICTLLLTVYWYSSLSTYMYIQYLAHTWIYIRHYSNMVHPTFLPPFTLCVKTQFPTYSIICIPLEDPGCITIKM